MKKGLMGLGAFRGRKARSARRMPRVAALVLGAALVMAALAGCAGTAPAGNDGSADKGSASKSNPIHVYAREDGSGTRSAFVELLGVEQKDAQGQKVDMTTTDAAITNSTSTMLTSVATDAGAIGYVSLGSLGSDSKVTAVAIDGVEPTAETVRDGSYAVSRSFNIVTKDGLGALPADFITFMLSADGQKVVQDNGYVDVVDAPASYQPAGLEGKVVVAGSSSVTPVMEKLAEAYEALNPGVTIEVQQSDSTTGVNMAVDGTCDIGMASRELKGSETSAGVASQAIARDGIAVVVSPATEVTSLTADQVCAIYIGDVTDWSALD